MTIVSERIPPHSATPNASDPGPSTSPTAAWAASPAALRLIASDMDGTLLDETGCIPRGFWPMLEQLHRDGITFVAASGRQYPALIRLFGGRTEGISFIAENGTYVVQDGIELSSTPLGRDYADRFIACVRAHVALGQDIGAVWCGRSRAYVERSDPGFLVEAKRYYAELQVVDAFEDVQEDALKFAMFVAGDPESAELSHLQGELTPCQVVVSSDHWIDVMPPDVSKGTALRTMQADLGITADETAVFGDYLNDLEMLDEATYSFAMANAHPEVIERARHLAPSNADQGVLRVVSQLIAGPKATGTDDVAQNVAEALTQR